MWFERHNILPLIVPHTRRGVQLTVRLAVEVPEIITGNLKSQNKEIDYVRRRVVRGM